MRCRLIIRLALAATLLTVSACLDVREEVWLDDSGGARIEATYDLPTNATLTFGGPDKLQDTILTTLRSCKELENLSCKVSSLDQRTRIRISMETRDVRTLRDLVSPELLDDLPPAVRKLAGGLEVKHDGLTLDIQRTIALGSAIPALKLIPQAKLTDHKLVYIIHLAEPAIESNATDTWNDRRSLLWEIPLADAIKQDHVTRLLIPAPIPWITVCLASGGLLIIIGVVWAIRRHLRRKTT